MSTIGGPNIGKETLDKLIFSFSPEENGVSQPRVIPGVSTFPLPKHSFNVTTSSLSPFYDPPTYLNDGWWSTPGRIAYDVNVQNNAPNQYPSGHYTSYANNNIAFTNFQYNVPYPITPSFLQNGITICGFINVDRFPKISQNIKKKLGISRLRATNDTNIRVGVRKANNSSKFNFGLQVSFLKNLRFSICTDYLYDVGNWYFYSAHFRFVDDSNGTIGGYMTINGVPVTTHFHVSFAFFNKQFKVSNAFREQYKADGTYVGPQYPVDTGFKNSSNVIADGNRTTEHSYSIVNNDMQCNVGNVKGGPTNIGNLTSTGLLANDNPLVIKFLDLYKNRNGGFSGLHDNVRLGQHFLINDYNSNVGNIYNSYKSLYL